MHQFYYNIGTQKSGAGLDKFSERLSKKMKFKVCSECVKNIFFIPFSISSL